MLFARRTCKAEQLRGIFPVERIGRACQCAGAKRAVIHSLINVLQAGTVSAKHFKICTDVVSQRDRLRFLQMGEARHECIDVLLHDPLQHLQKLAQQMVGVLHFSAHIEPHIQGDLVIPAASGVQLLADVSDPVDQVRLHEAVDILILRCDLQCPALHIRKDTGQPLQNLIALLIRQNLLLRQHPDMGHATFYVLPVQTFIK